MSARELKKIESELYSLIKNKFPFLSDSGVEKVVSIIQNYGLDRNLREEEIIEKGIERWDKRYKENKELIDSCCKKLEKITRLDSAMFKYYAVIVVDNVINKIPTHWDIKKGEDKIYLYNSGPYRAILKGGEVEIEKGEEKKSFCCLRGAQMGANEYYKVNKPLKRLCEIANIIQEKFNERITGKKIKINKKLQIFENGFVGCIEEITLKE
jgi:mRNA-degrading endonuclease RelE of RelBE toxin-antitoxin system